MRTTVCFVVVILIFLIALVLERGNENITKFVRQLKCVSVEVLIIFKIYYCRYYELAMGT